MSSPESFTPASAPRSNTTLIIVLVVLGAFLLMCGVSAGIIAMIAVPRAMKAGNKAKELTLKANLHMIRNAVEMYYADTGTYPATLEDLTRPHADAPKTGVDEKGLKVSLPAGSYYGPYLSEGGIANTGIPINPYKKPADPDYNKVSAHWRYGIDGPGVVLPTVPVEGNYEGGVPYSNL